MSNDDIAVITLRLNGSEPNELEIKQKSKGIQKMFDSYSNHCLNSYAFCLMSKEIKDFCHEKYGEHYVHGMKRLPQ